MNLTASLASVFGIFRFLWAIPLDCGFSFRQVYGLLIVIKIIVAFGMHIFIKSSNVMFLLCVGFSQLCQGGHFVLVPTIFAKLFGTDGGMRVYGVGYAFVGAASLINMVIVEIFSVGGPVEIGF